MGCGPNDPGFAVRFEVEASGLSFSSASRRTVGPHPATSASGTDGCFLVVKAAGPWGFTYGEGQTDNFETRRTLFQEILLKIVVCL